MAADDFILRTSPEALSAPAMYGEAVTPNDSTDLTYITRALYIGGAGDLTVDLYGGQTAILFANVPAGTVLPLMVKRVRSTGTTATSIVTMR